MSAAHTVRRTYKYHLYTNKRDRHLRRQINIAGLVWNHALALQKRYYRLTGAYISLGALKAHIARLRRHTQRFGYWQLLTAQTVQDVLERLERAYQRFFQWVKTRTGIKVSPPKFKKVKKFRSFTLKQDGWKLLNSNANRKVGQIQIGKQVYKYVQHRPLEGSIRTVTVKRDTAGRLWLCFSVEMTFQPMNEVSTGKIGGFDFGLKTFLTDNEGRPYLNPLYFKGELKRIQILNRSLSRKQKTSRNRRIANWQLSRTHIRIADKRRDYLFQLANDLCDEYDVMIFEDLNLSAMGQLWGRKVRDVGFGQFVTILQHIARKCGKRVVLIDRWERTTGVCSYCEHTQKLELRDRVFGCAHCGVVLDRDHNAARNILRIGASMLGLEVVRPTLVGSLV